TDSNGVVIQRITDPAGAGESAADLIVATADCFASGTERCKPVVDPDPVLDVLDPAHGIGEVLGDVFHPPLRHFPGQGHHATFDYQQDFGGVQLVMVGHSR